MTTLYNFSVNKYIYKQDQYFIWYQIMPKGKKYVITKKINVNAKDLKRVLKHLKNNKNISFHKEHVTTWVEVA